MLVWVLSLPGNLATPGFLGGLSFGGLCDMEYAVKRLKHWQRVQGCFFHCIEYLRSFRVLCSSFTTCIFAPQM